MAGQKQTKTFTASTELKAREQMSRWREDHPTAKIAEKDVTVATGIVGTRNEGQTLVTIVIEYEE